MSDLKTFSNSAGGNTSPSPNGFPEGMAPSSVNDSARELMASVRRWYEDAEWIDRGNTPTYATTASFTLAGDQRTPYHIGRRLRCAGATTTYGKIADATYSASTRISVTLDSGQLDVSLSAVAIGILSFTNQSIPEISATASYARNAASVTDGANTIKTKIIEIGDWNMDATDQVLVAHGLDGTKIRSVSAFIYLDGYPGSSVWSLITSGTIGGSVQGTAGWNGTNIILNRTPGGYFDDPSYDSTSFNRGWITITYVV